MLPLDRVLIAHNAVAPGDDASTADVLDQVAVVEDALALLRIPAVRAEVSHGRAWESPLLAAASAADEGQRARSVVFNLVEAPAGAPYFHTGNAAALELMGLSFTGSPAPVLCLTTDKLVTRAVLAAAGLPVAAGCRLDAADPAALDRVPPPWIVKPAWEDGSLGLEGNPVCATADAVLARASLLAERFPGQPILVEHFLPGRELNVALLAEGSSTTAGGVTALPVAEIAFVDFPVDLPPIVGYEAKWQPGSFAYAHTPRRFPDRDGDAAEAALLARAREISLAAWKVCGLAGYARVDLRLDEAGEPRILEVNANPCLAADAGFLAASEKAGLTAKDVVERIVRAVCRPLPRPETPRPLA